MTKVLVYIRASCLDSPKRLKIISWKIYLWKVLRHFCNDLILRDCEMPILCFSCDIPYIILYTIYLILYFLYDIPYIILFIRKAYSIRGLGYRVYIEVSIPRRAY